MSESKGQVYLLHTRENVERNRAVKDREEDLENQCYVADLALSSDGSMSRIYMVGSGSIAVTWLQSD